MASRHPTSVGDEATSARPFTAVDAVACGLNVLALAVGAGWLLLAHPLVLTHVAPLAALLVAATGLGLWLHRHADELREVAAGAAVPASSGEMLRDLAAAELRLVVTVGFELATWLVITAGATLGALAGVLLVACVAYAGTHASRVPPLVSLPAVGACAAFCAAEVTALQRLTELRRAIEGRLATPPFRVAQEPCVRILDDGSPAPAALATPGDPAVLVIGDEQAGPLCQVCGTAIVGPHVRCERCHTPHHGDCWEYARECSTYGCRCCTSVGREA